MSAKSPFFSRLSLSRGDNNNNSSRHPPLRNQYSEYDLDQLSPHPDDDDAAVLSPDFHDPNSPPRPQSSAKAASSNRKPTGAINRRPSNSSSGGSSSKARRFGPPHHDRLLFSGPPPPIAVSRVLYRDEEQQFSSSNNKYDDDDDNENDNAGVAASWLPGTARRAISSVMWDPAEPHDLVARERPIAYDRNSVWRSLARREKAIVHDVQRFLQVQEDSLGGDSEPEPRSPSVSDAGSSTPTGAATASLLSSRNPHRSVSFLEPVTRSGPGGEVIPVRQPRPKKLGIGGARKGITRSLAQLADLKAEEEASLLAALSTRKQALGQLRRLATRHEGIAEELKALETDEQEPLAKELEELDGEYKGVCAEIRELEERLASLKTRRRYLEGRIDDVTNRREAGLSGYKNALREVEDSVRGFLARPPVKPLDLEALADNMRWESPPPSPGGVEFLHMRPERRTTDMARDWWEAEVAILEKRKAAVDTERAALEEGGAVWQEVVGLVLAFEADLRRQVMMTTTTTAAAAAASSTTTTDDVKGKGRADAAEDTGGSTQVLQAQYDQIRAVVAALEQKLGIVEHKGWNLLIAAVGAELEAFREAADVSRAMLTAAGVAVDDGDSDSLLLPGPPASGRRTAAAREDSGTTGTSASFHTVHGGTSSVTASQQLLDLPNHRGDEAAAAAAAMESDNEVPLDLLTTAAGESEQEEGEGPNTQPVVAATPGIAPFDREDSENEVPPEFLVEHHDTRD